MAFLFWSIIQGESNAVRHEPLIKQLIIVFRRVVRDGHREHCGAVGEQAAIFDCRSSPHLHQKKRLVLTSRFFSYICLWQVILLPQFYLANAKFYCTSYSLRANIISLKPKVSISLLLCKNITPSKMEYHIKH